MLLFNFRERRKKKHDTKNVCCYSERELVMQGIIIQDQIMPKYYPHKHTHYKVISFVI